MKAKTASKTFAFTFLLLCAAFFTGCPNGITEPVLTELKKLGNQRSINMPILSEMSEEECVELIIENGVIIPDIFINSPELGAFVKKLIQQAECNPNRPLPYNWDVTYYFAESIRAFVNGYYGITGTALSSSSATSSASAYSLQYNWVFTNSDDWGDSDGYWDPVWENYNCYAYAIGRTEQPKEYASGFQYQPGDFAHTGNFNSSISIYDLALVVKDDLEFLGYSDVDVTNVAPDLASLEPNQKLICIREGIFYGFARDYHLMKYNANDGYWYHKPGGTAPLRYKYHPSIGDWNSVTSEYEWLCEYSHYGSEGLDDGYYFGDIYYIVYNEFGALIGSIDITFDTNNMLSSWNSQSVNLLRREAGIIGTVSLYESGAWTVTGGNCDIYFVEYDSEDAAHPFFNILDFSYSPGLESYLTQNNITIPVPLTIEFPSTVSYDYILIYGSISFDIEITGTGVSSMGNEVFTPLFNITSYVPLPITALPASGTIDYGPGALIGSIDINFDTNNMLSSWNSQSVNLLRREAGIIGTVSLYESGAWTVTGGNCDIYFVEYDSEDAAHPFFNILDFSYSPGLESYLTQNNIIIPVPLTVEFPSTVSYDYILIYGSISFDIEITGTGVSSMENEAFTPLFNITSYVPLPITALPESGTIE